MKHLLPALLCLLPTLASAQTSTQTPAEASTRPDTIASLSANAPQSHAQMWEGVDPTSDPLDVEVLHAWEEDGVVLQVVRYCVGTFKGKKAMMAAVYGYPKDGTNLPGLVNIHGGGQYADYNSPLTNARRGYATITIAWAGRISAPGYRVSPNEVKLFWERKTDAPNYKVTTDWGALDAYHAPSKNGQDAFVTIRDGSENWTLDSVKSPRNSSWFLCALAARRALTFLQQQPQVDNDRLGVYGHSMGGKLTVLTSGSDKRVKAAAPSCGGISDRYNPDALHRNTVGDSPSVKNIGCPTIILSPANDFHGHINDLDFATRELQHEWRVTCAPHLNHVDMPEHEVATQLWFDQHLKDTFTWPETPKTDLQISTDSGTPIIQVSADASKKILDVEVYYTQQGQLGGDRALRENRIARYWHYAKPIAISTSSANSTSPPDSPGASDAVDSWIAELPIFSTDMPLWVYANVTYALDQPISGAGYYYGNYTTDRFTVSSLIQMTSAKQLQSAGVTPSLQTSMLIEDFAGDWRKDWFNRNRNEWAIRTHKVYHPMWAAPAGAKLSLEVRSEQPNKFVVGIDSHGAEVSVPGGTDWHTITLAATDFLDADESPLTNWTNIKELRLIHSEHLRSGKRGSQTRRLIGAAWKGAAPEFRKLQWVVSDTSSTNQATTSKPETASVPSKNAKQLARMDANQDGKVNRQEYEGFFAKLFGRIDKNQNGMLDATEFKNEGAMKFGDSDKDGNLTSDEYQSIFKRQFKNLDKNKDGIVSPDELPQ